MVMEEYYLPADIRYPLSKDPPLRLAIEVEYIFFLSVTFAEDLLRSLHRKGTYMVPLAM